MSHRLCSRRAPLCAALSLVSCVPAGWCQQPAPPPGSAELLQQVVVTAARAPEPADQSLFSVTVLTRADIEARQVSSLPDLLADLAGINIDKTGGLGQQSSVFIRGADSDHTLLLIDGVRVGSATLGTAPFEIIPLEQIERIELVRGPRSTLYGSDAVGGVIQVFTRQAGDPGVTLGGSAMTGSFDTHEFTGYAAARSRAAWGSLSADVLTTAGIAACLPSAVAGCFDPAAPQVPDGHQNRSGSLNAGLRLTDELTASADVLYTHGWTAFDGAGFDDRLDFQEKVFNAHLDGDFGDGWHVRLMAGRDEDDERDFLDPTPVGTFDTIRNSASLQTDARLGAALRLVSGVDYESVHVDSDTPFALTSRTTRAAFGELHADWAGWTALAGARFERNGQFGDHWTENLGLTRKLAEGLRFVLNWGTAFRAPTFDELYFPGFGNPNLKPETSQSYEAGLDGEEGALRWSLHAYQTTIDEEISIDPVTFLNPVNIDKARIRGVELQANWHGPDWVVDGQLTGLEPLNVSPGAEYDDLLPRRAQQSASLTVRRLIHEAAAAAADGSVGLVARWQGRRYDDLANTLPMGGYLTLDLLTQWVIGSGWSLEARAANLFDRSYQTAAYYAQPGRSYGVTIRYRSSLH